MPDPYALIDAGDGRRLERFGERVVDRPAPMAGEPRRAPSAWATADARFERGRSGVDGWETHGAASAPWTVDLAGVRLELRLASGGQVGLFPEHLAQAGWLRDRVAATSRGPLLHLFAYTGALTLVAATAGAPVAHVDASRAAVAWARRNADVTGAASCPIRWLVEDAERFVRREHARGRRYAGVVLDPPTYGHGPGGQAWRIEDRLDPLLRAAVALLDGRAAYVLLTAHTVGIDGDALADRLAAALAEAGVARAAGAVEAGELGLTAESGASLRLGAFARWSGAIIAGGRP